MLLPTIGKFQLRKTGPMLAIAAGLLQCTTAGASGLPNPVACHEDGTYSAAGAALEDEARELAVQTMFNYLSRNPQ